MKVAAEVPVLVIVTPGFPVTVTSLLMVVAAATVRFSVTRTVSPALDAAIAAVMVVWSHPTAHTVLVVAACAGAMKTLRAKTNPARMA
jgi:hypothetical protein